MKHPDKNKYKNAALFFIKHCNGPYLGKTKMSKLFYYLDFISFRDNGKSVTGETYDRLGLGPYPRNLMVILPEAEKEGLLKINTNEVVHDGETYDSWSFSKITEPNLEVFDEYEKGLLIKICDEFKNWTPDQLINQTHFEAPWVYSAANEPLDYTLADDIEFFERVAA